MELPASRSTGTTGPLVCIRLADRGNLERIHTHLGVVYLQFAVSSIHNVMDTINCRHNDQQKGAD